MENRYEVSISSGDGILYDRVSSWSFSSAYAVYDENKDSIPAGYVITLVDTVTMSVLEQTRK